MADSPPRPGTVPQVPDKAAAAGRTEAIEESTPAQLPAAVTSTEKMSTGGLRGAFTGLRKVSVPPVSSLLGTTALFVSAVLLVTVLVTVGDRALHDLHLRGPLPGSLRAWSGRLALAAASVAATLVLTLPFDGDESDREHTAGQRRRFRLAFLCTLTALALGALWSVGAAV